MPMLSACCSSGPGRSVQPSPVVSVLPYPSAVPALAVGIRSARVRSSSGGHTALPPPTLRTDDVS